MIAQVYMDDILFGGMSQELVDLLVKQMQTEFEMSMVGALTYFLGFQINQLDDGIFISQSKYAKGIVKKFGLVSASAKRILAPTHVKLSKDSEGSNVDENLYRCIIGSLLYLTTNRLDIAFAVGVYARYLAHPKSSHLLTAKHIIKYINGTSE